MVELTRHVDFDIKLKDANTTVGLWTCSSHRRSAIIHRDLSLLDLGSCRIIERIVSGRRSESHEKIEIMVLRHQVRILQLQLHARVRSGYWCPSARTVRRDGLQ
jgi:hypothetical protein